MKQSNAPGNEEEGGFLSFSRYDRKKLETWVNVITDLRLFLTQSPFFSTDGGT